jgi:hypothetical protein
MRGVIYKSAIAREISSSAQNACLAAGFRPDSLMELKRFSRLPKPQWVSWKGLYSRNAQNLTYSNVKIQFFQGTTPGLQGREVRGEFQHFLPAKPMN